MKIPKISHVMNIFKTTKTQKELVGITGPINTSEINTTILNGYNIANMLNNPHADEFIKSAKEQKAEIINDIIMPIYKENSRPERFISKKMRSGTIITKSFCSFGPSQKEVISSSGNKSITLYSTTTTPDAFAIKCSNGTYITKFLDKNIHKTEDNNLFNALWTNITERANNK